MFLAAQGLLAKYGPPASPASAVSELLDGDPDPDEWRRLMHYLAEAPVGALSPEMRVQAAAAALVTRRLAGDRKLYEQAREAWDSTGIIPTGDDRVSRERRLDLALGEPAIAALWHAEALRALSPPATSRIDEALARARGAARLARLGLVVELATP